ncbi:MAG: ferric siderophore receptor protein, partial [Methylobacterium sp.]
LGLRHAAVLDGRRTTFRANVLNATGTRYSTGVAAFGTVFQGGPRTSLLSMSIDL